MQGQNFRPVMYSLKKECFLSSEGERVELSAALPSVLIADRQLSFSLEQDCLSSGERQREDRFRQLSDRQLFRTAHFLQRAACGAVLKKSASALCFTQDERGKPCLEKDRLFFNLSHSGSWSGLALGGNVPLGFDVQHPVDPDWLPPDLFRHPQDCIAADFSFSAAQLWAVKEAVVKECGLGLSLSLGSFAVEETAEAQLKKVSFPERTLFIRHFMLSDGSALAVASSSAEELHGLGLYEVTALLP